MNTTTGQIQVPQESKYIHQFCADQSLKRPGFALLEFDKESGKVSVLRKSIVDNKTERKSHGQLLAEIAKEIKTYLRDLDTGNMILVRERGFYKTPVETIALAKVAGVADLYAYSYHGATFDEIAPSSIKKLVTGNYRADKQEVANALEQYVGKLEYRSDDESDAIAVGIAWLIQHKYL